MWWGPVGGNTVFLYAGSKLENDGVNSLSTSEQSVILYSDQGVTSDTEYLAPSNHGVLAFTSSDGTCLTLTAADGMTFRFDAANRTWLCK